MAQNIDNNQGAAIGSSNVNIGEIKDMHGGKTQIAGHDIITNIGTVVVGQVDAAFGALKEMIQWSDAVREAVISFRTNFQTACEQIEILGDYKDLHDILHQLQLHCYIPLLQCVGDFPDDVETLGNVMAYQLTLDGLVIDAQQVVQRDCVVKQVRTWVDKLNEANVCLDQAVNEMDSEALKDSLWIIERILAKEPAKINIRLNDAARALKLPFLIESLTIIFQEISDLDLDPTKLHEFNDGVNALSGLENKLTVLVDNHDQWQEMDDELRLIEADMDELPASWPHLEAKLELLCKDCEDQRVQSLRDISEKLVNALKVNNPSMTNQYFRTFHGCVRRNFFKVDIELKRLCNQLRTIGAPLDAVLRLLA